MSGSSISSTISMESTVSFGQVKLLVVRTLLDNATAVFQCYTTYASVSLLHCLLIVCLPLPQQDNKHPTLTDIIQLFLYLCVCFIVCRLVVVCLFVCLPLPQEDNKHSTLTDLILLFLYLCVCFIVYLLLFVCLFVYPYHRRTINTQPSQISSCSFSTYASVSLFTCCCLFVCLFTLTTGGQ